MALPSFMRAQTFTRARYPMASDHGTQTTDYTAEPDRAVFRGSIQPGTGTRDIINREGAEIVKTIFASPDADVEHRDLVEIRGQSYQVNGEPERWEVGILDHLVIRLSRWDG